jgi:hypothetical protein
VAGGGAGAAVSIPGGAERRGPRQGGRHARQVRPHAQRPAPVRTAPPLPSLPRPAPPRPATPLTKAHRSKFSRDFEAHTCRPGRSGHSRRGRSGGHTERARCVVGMRCRGWRAPRQELSLDKVCDKKLLAPSVPRTKVRLGWVALMGCTQSDGWAAPHEGTEPSQRLDSRGDRWMAAPPGGRRRPVVTRMYTSTRPRAAVLEESLAIVRSGARSRARRAVRDRQARVPHSFPTGTRREAEEAEAARDSRPQGGGVDAGGGWRLDQHTP